MDHTQEQEYYYQLGINIKEARKTAGLSQEILAEQLGLSRASIVNVEKGRHRLNIHILVELAEALKVNIEKLLPSRATVANGNKMVAATLPRIITDKPNVDPKTEQAVANFMIYLENK
jgi:transcriptional regulator with XRE-family HTH domain